MDDAQRQSLDSLGRVARLQLSRSRSGKHGALDTSESCGTDETRTLSNLAGELQDLIITNLHPSAAIALSRTNRHFNSCASLHRLSFSAVFDYLHEMELLPTRSGDYACYTCLRLKPRSAFGLKQTKRSRGKTGLGSCGKVTPGSIINNGTELQVYCMGCETLRRRFCSECHWCDSCIRKGAVEVLRKRPWARYGEANEVIHEVILTGVSITNICGNHTWEGPESGPSRSSLSIMQSLAMCEFESDYGIMIAKRWILAVICRRVQDDISNLPIGTLSASPVDFYDT